MRQGFQHLKLNLAVTGLRFHHLMGSRIVWVAPYLLLISTGCSNPISKLMFANHKNRNPAMSAVKKEERSQEQAHRASYRSTRSSDDLEWLMKNRIENGLTLESVNNIIGQKGKSVADQEGIAQASGRSDREEGIYEYGPDDKGQVYRVTFRNSRVVDFTPVAFRSEGSGVRLTSDQRAAETLSRKDSTQGETPEAAPNGKD